MAWENPCNYGRSDRINRGGMGPVIFDETTNFGPSSPSSIVKEQSSERLRLDMDKFMKYGALQRPQQTIAQPE